MHDFLMIAIELRFWYNGPHTFMGGEMVPRKTP